MIIDCISDLHGHYPKLEGGDLLIVAGDLTANDTPECFLKFKNWLVAQRGKYRKVINIAGNHDNLIEKRVVMGPEFTLDSPWLSYLEDSGTEFEDLKIWASPWTKTFPGMNPMCKAFTVDTDEELAEKWSLIPDDVDILITHSPPYGVLDRVKFREFVGSGSLRLVTVGLHKMKLHVFGHIHECGGETLDTGVAKFVNASHVNERYEPVNKPVRVIL